MNRTPIGARALAVSAAILSVLSTLLSYQVARNAGRPVLHVELAVMNTSYWTFWAVMAPPIVWLAQRFRFEANSWMRALAVHLPAGLLFCVLHSMAMAVVRWGIALAAARPGQYSVWRIFRQTVLPTLDWQMMVYWMIVGAALAVAYREEARIRALAAAQLETQLVQAQLRALENQLHPHFLFNALNAVVALMHRDVPLAERTLVRLGDLLRSTLRHIGRQDVLLREELEFTRNYLDIEQTRLQDRLTVRFDVSPDTLDALVPWMMLQPLVENAVKHGIAPQRRPGTIEIIIRRDDSRLHIVVRDDGAGVSSDAMSALSAGTGLATVRARLQFQFGDAHEFQFLPRPRGLEVCIAIPWRPGPTASDENSHTQGYVT